MGRIDDLLHTLKYMNIESPWHLPDQVEPFAIDTLAELYEISGEEDLTLTFQPEDILTQEERFYEVTRRSLLGPLGPSRKSVPKTLTIVPIPNEILTLQKILGLRFSCDVIITGVGNRCISKKAVKEIYFMLEGGGDYLLHKAWVLEACDPKQTARSLIGYRIAYEAGIKTAEPLGEFFGELYPHNTAILVGAVVDDAGDPYTRLIPQMNLDPDRLHQSAICIAKMLADFHVRLTAAHEKFNEYGFDLQYECPKRDIKETFLKVLDIPETNANAARIIQLFGELYQLQTGTYVVSHGDVHTNNILTLQKRSDTAPRLGTHVREFAIIDLDSLCYARQLRDATDFWIHHQREAIKACSGYNFGIDDLIKGYQEQFNELQKVYSLGTEFMPSEMDEGVHAAQRHFCEMYDPTRKDKTDIERKARLHCEALWNELDSLERRWNLPQTAQIKSDLRELLKDRTYLEYILSRN